MYSNPTTCDKGSENYRANAGASPKYETTKYKPAVKQGYHNNKQKFAHGVVKTTNDGRHDNQKRYDNHDNQNRDRCARLGIIRVANDAKTDNQRRYENGDNHQNRYTHVGMRGADGGRYENQKKYDKYDNYENYNRFDNHNHNRYDHPNRYGNQSRRDNHNRYDKQIGRREDVQGRFMDKIGKMNRSEPKVQRQHQEDLVAAHTWRVVCDSMLGGLSSKLRMCGVDCVHVLFDQGGDDSAKLAMRENRILLTRNKNYERVRISLLHLSHLS